MAALLQRWLRSVFERECLCVCVSMCLLSVRLCVCTTRTAALCFGCVSKKARARVSVRGGGSDVTFMWDVTPTPNTRLESEMDTATHCKCCNMLQYAATCCNYTPNTRSNIGLESEMNAVTRCNMLQHAATYCNILEHTRKHCTSNSGQKLEILRRERGHRVSPPLYA